MSEYTILHIVALAVAAEKDIIFPCDRQGPEAWDTAPEAAKALDLVDLPWKALLEAAINRAMGAANVKVEHSAQVSRHHLMTLLNRLGLRDKGEFEAHMRGFGTRPPVNAILNMQGHTDASLRPLSRPGAWLLDYCHTIFCKVEHTTRDTAQFVPVSNASHREVLHACFPALAEDPTNSSPNNRGNQMESLAWLMLEADRTDLLLALAYWLFMDTHVTEAAGPVDTQPPTLSILQQFLQSNMARGEAAGGTSSRAPGPSSPPKTAPAVKAMPTRGPR